MKRTWTIKRPLGLLPSLAVFVGVFVAAALVSVAASAADISPSTQSADDNATLEELVVTARRRAESLQSTPVAITALSGDALKVRGINTVAEAANFTPNATFDSTAPISGSSNAGAFFIRGVGQAEFLLTNDPGIGVYVDGVYMARTIGAVVDAVDLERMEILRGPQGTLFGKNTLGGAIQIISESPAEESGGRLSITLGADNRRNAVASVDMPLVDNRLLSRFTVSSRHIDGYGERILTGEELGDEDALVGRAKFLYTPSENLTVSLALDATKIRESSPASVSPFHDGELLESLVANSVLTSLYNTFAAPVIDVPGLGTNVPYDRRFLTRSKGKTYATGPIGSSLDSWGIGNTLTWTFGGLTLTSITGYREMDSEFGRDPDASPLGIVHTANEVEADQWSQEFRLQGKSGAVDWVIGAYYLNESGSDFLDAPIVTDLYELIGLDLHIYGQYFTDNDTYALFAHADWALSESWKLAAGVRFSRDRKRFKSEQILKFGGEPLVEFGWFDETYDSVAPLLGLEYQLNEETMAYANLTRGFKSGGYVGRYVSVTNRPPREFDPETLDTLEFGLKSDLMNDRLRLNAALFVSRYDDMQVLIFEGIVPLTKNAGTADISGAELELLWVPSGQWQVEVSLGYLDAEYRDLDPRSGVPEGNDFVNVPEWTAAAALSQQGQWTDAITWQWRVDYAWRSEVANDVINTPWLIEGALGLWNARASVLIGQDWEISAYGENLSNEQYVVSGAADIPTFGAVEANYSRGREWGVTVDYHF